VTDILGAVDGDGATHGRVNLIGEHTDYNGGLVLPTLIPQRTVVAIRTRTDRVIALRSDAAGSEPVEISFDERAPRHDWSDHVVGVVDALAKQGHELRGFDALVRSDVPLGAGLASSAALAVASARALREAFGLALDDRQIAHVAHQSENAFVGARVGTMDQLVCSLGREGEALFIDASDGSTRRVPLGDLETEIAVIDSGIRHDNATGEYNRRREECEEAARVLRVRSLRDLASGADLARLSPVLARRVRHVLSENARVLAALNAIEGEDAAALGGIVNDGHASLRDDFEVSLPEIDAIVAAAQRDAAVYGARLTGGGFGGSVLVLARNGEARAAAGRVVASAGGHVVVPAA
jgi:galactokinase